MKLDFQPEWFNLIADRYPEHVAKLFVEGAKVISEDEVNTSAFLTCVAALRVALKRCKPKKNYYYAITITRNPAVQTLTQFVKYAERIHKMKYFKNSSYYSWAYEAFKEGKLINEHVHIYVQSDTYLSVKDLKKSFPHRIDVDKLYGDKIFRTINYLKKDNLCDRTKNHYSPYFDKHYGEVDSEQSCTFNVIDE